MDIFSSGFIAQISYLEDKIAKTWKYSPWGHFLVFGICSKLNIYFC
jgi:hypothetical protein